MAKFLEVVSFVTNNRMRIILFYIVLSVFAVSFTSYSVESTSFYSSYDKSSKIIISPNPARTFVRITCAESNLKIRYVSIHSILGEEVISNTLKSPETQIDINVSRLNKGKYFVKVLYSDGSQDMETLIKL